MQLIVACDLAMHLYNIYIICVCDTVCVCVCVGGTSATGLS